MATTAASHRHRRYPKRITTVQTFDWQKSNPLFAGPFQTKEEYFNQPQILAKDKPHKPFATRCRKLAKRWFSWLEADVVDQLINQTAKTSATPSIVTFRDACLPHASDFSSPAHFVATCLQMMDTIKILQQEAMSGEGVEILRDTFKVLTKVKTSEIETYFDEILTLATQPRSSITKCQKNMATTIFPLLKQTAPYGRIYFEKQDDSTTTTCPANPEDPSRP